MSRARDICLLPLSGVLIAITASGCEHSAITGDAATGMPNDTGGSPWFEEVAASVGIDFVHESGHKTEYYFPEGTCGGGALVDVDGDGHLDVYLVQSGVLGGRPGSSPPNRLYRNHGDGTFEDVTEGSGTGDRGYGMGVAAGDYDNDGDLDLYVTNYGPNVMLRNDGNGRFEDVTSQTATGAAGWSTSAVFFDYDADGHLDLFICNYVNWTKQTEIDCFNDMGEPDYCGPTNYDAPTIDTLYHNNGDGTFTDVTDAAGLPAAFGTGLGVIAGDFNGDRMIDIFVANDGMPDQLWINDGDGTFHDEAIFAGVAVDGEGTATSSMGVTAADIDDDGDLDLLICNLNRESDSLFINEGSYFTDRTAPLGLASASRPFTRFGMAWIDLDHDGLLDLFQANGRVYRQSLRFDEANAYAEPNMVLRGTPDGSFEEVHPRGGTITPIYATSRAAAFGDVNGDGAIDVLVVNRDGPPHLLINRAATKGNWISFRVIDEHGRDAYGATVRLQADERRIIRDVRSAYSYLAANDPRVHVGLGGASRVTDVEVQWVDGTTESFGAFDVGRVVELRRR